MRFMMNQASTVETVPLITPPPSFLGGLRPADLYEKQ